MNTLGGGKAFTRLRLPKRSRSFFAGSGGIKKKTIPKHVASHKDYQREGEEKAAQHAHASLRERIKRLIPLRIERKMSEMTSISLNSNSLENGSLQSSEKKKGDLHNLLLGEGERKKVPFSSEGKIHSISASEKRKRTKSILPRGGRGGEGSRSLLLVGKGEQCAISTLITKGRGNLFCEGKGRVSMKKKENSLSRKKGEKGTVYPWPLRTKRREFFGLQFVGRRGGGGGASAREGWKGWLSSFTGRKKRDDRRLLSLCGGRGKESAIFSSKRKGKGTLPQYPPRVERKVKKNSISFLFSFHVQRKKEGGERGDGASFHSGPGEIALNLL